MTIKPSVIQKYVLAAITFLLATPAIVFAQAVKIPGANCTAWGIICTGTDTPTNLQNYVWRIISVVLVFIATIAAAALVYYGALYIMSKGEEEQLRKAKTGIIFAIIGVFVAGLAAWVVNSIINL